MKVEREGEIKIERQEMGRSEFINELEEGRRGRR